MKSTVTINCMRYLLKCLIFQTLDTCIVFLKADPGEDQLCCRRRGHSPFTSEPSYTSCCTSVSPSPRSISHLPPAVYSISDRFPRHPATPLSSQPLFTSSGSPLPDLHQPYLQRISRVNNPQFDSIRGKSVSGGPNGLGEIISEDT